MPETGAQSGVRSLLAKFENNNQNSTTSPPSRGRSPVGSDTPGSTRPLSKVRANFVAVDRAAESSPVSSLRKESGRSDSPLRSVSSEDVETSLKSPISLPRSNGQEAAFKTENNNPADETLHSTTERKELADEKRDKVDKAILSETASTKEHSSLSSRPAAAAPAEQPQKQSPAPTAASKRPSNVNAAKSKTAAITAAKSPSTSSPKSDAHPRTTSTTKPVSDRTSKPARQTSASTTKKTADESTKTVAHRPSRTTLKPATKTTTVGTSRNTTESTAPSAAPNSKPARLPTSATTPSLSSAAKAGNTSRQGTGTATSNLNRKPSSLRTATNGGQRATTPTNSSIRKQASRASLPSQTSNERPGSRTSNVATKPVNEGFLARMMRPTASSASKAHDKIEVKSPPRPSKSAPKRVASKAELRPSRPKDVPEKTQKEKPLPEAKKPAEPKEQVTYVQSEEQKAKQEARHPPLDSPEKSQDVPVEVAEKTPIQDHKESPAQGAAQGSSDAQDKRPVELSVESSTGATQETSGVSKPEESIQQSADSGENSADAMPSAPEVHVPAISEPAKAEPESTPTEPVATSPAAPSTDTPDNATSAGLKEPINADKSAESSVETSFVDTVETATPADSKPDEVDVGSNDQTQEEKPIN
ncbi:hypothetical protein PHISCL_02110 [Aspergillus sclerotialis]|uniref:Mucin-7 n=1 Tax=Aspergillus sclerotialis TaxID=2070753 RepID=A0A3A2ZS83_9EURO|nr:hypothetical protein PHISCL_02110 [Aspergillus sclerotialis]